MASSGTTSSSVVDEVVVLGDAPRLAPLGPSERGDVDVEGRPRPGGAVALREAVHDRVAAVREDDEQDTDAVVGRAPERLDPVQRRAVADDRDDGPLGERHAHAGRSRKRETEPAHGRAEEAEGLAREEAVVKLGPVDGSLLDENGLRGSRSASAERTWPARSGSPAAGGSGAGGGRNCSGVLASRAGNRCASSRHAAAGGASTASSAGLRWISSGLSPMTAIRVPGSVKRPRLYGDWRKTGAPTTRTAS